MDYLLWQVAEDSGRGDISAIGETALTTSKIILYLIIGATRALSV